MRTQLPTSRAVFKFRISIPDFVCALISPLLALYVRDAYTLTYELVSTVVLYWAISVGFSLIGFLVFRLHDGIARHFSVHDALDVAKAVVFAQLMTTVVIFTFTRLEGIPRSTPLIQALILGAALIAIRAFAHVRDNSATNGQYHSARENIIMIGATHVSALYIKLLGACSSGQRRVIAVLDDRPRFVGRSVAGVRILAAPNHLEAVIEEFGVHGIRTDRVIIGDDENILLDEELTEIQRVCEQCKLKFDFVPQLIGLDELARASIETTPKAEHFSSPNFEVPRYFKFRSLFDFFAALAMTIVLSPLLLIAATLALLDVGLPVLFWQQRIGQGGRRFMVQKFRTLQPPFDWRGQPVPDRQKLSFIGQMLRTTRLDELPQLLNVLVGDMALIGPRPLLPEDQPANPATRLMVRPGITGWAQVNGGKYLTPEEKDQYDEFYIRNASPWFDLRIIFMTLKVLFRFTANSDHAVAADSVVGFGKTDDRQSTITAKQPTVHTAKAKPPHREVESRPIGAQEVSPNVVRLSRHKSRSSHR
jgi:lipopolysaccharide/colanic/teichoic acid biosynthesis glycosyltransferase